MGAETENRRVESAASGPTDSGSILRRRSAAHSALATRDSVGVSEEARRRNASKLRRGGAEESVEKDVPELWAVGAEGTEAGGGREEEAKATRDDTDAAAKVRDEHCAERNRAEPDRIRLGSNLDESMCTKQCCTPLPRAFFCSVVPRSSARSGRTARQPQKKVEKIARNCITVQ